MNFLFLGIFFRIFPNLFRFLNDKNELKGQKAVFISAQDHVDATWHTRPRGSAKRAHATPTRRGDVCTYLYLYLYSL